MQMENKARVYICYSEKKEMLISTVKTVLKNHLEIPVHLYLDEDIVMYYGTQNYNAVADILKSTEKLDETIKYSTLFDIIDENLNCNLNVLVVTSKMFYDQYINFIKNEYHDYEHSDNMAQFIETEITEENVLNKLKSYFTQNNEKTLRIEVTDAEKKKAEKPAVIMVAGFPGSGKSTVGKYIAKRERIAFIDKDTLARKVSDKAIEVQNSYPGDYETNAYGGSIRRAQYQDMGLVAAVNLELNRSVLITAPFTSQARVMFKSVTESLNDTIKMRELFLNPLTDAENASIKENASFKEIDLFFVWVRTSRAIEHARIYARGARRDAWKLSHWIRHAGNQDATSKEFEEYIEEKKEKASLSIFDNEYDDDMDWSIDKVCKEIERYFKGKRQAVQLENDFSWERVNSNRDDLNKSVRDYSKDVGKKDCYFADIYISPDSVLDINNEAINDYCNIMKECPSVFYYDDKSKAHAIVFRGREFETATNIGEIIQNLNIGKDGTVGSSKIKQIIFEHCIFKDTLSLKKLPFDLEFNECEFKDTVVFFNRRDAGHFGKINISIFRCIFEDDCIIRETNVCNLSVVDSVLQDMILDRVLYEDITVFNSAINKLDIGANCTRTTQDNKMYGTFNLRDSRIQDFIRLPNTEIAGMVLSGNQINDIRFSQKTLEDLAKSDSLKEDKDTKLPLRVNALLRKADTCNTLYKALTEHNNYVQADQCVWYARKLEHLAKKGNIKSNKVSAFLKKRIEDVKYFTTFYCFGGGIRLINLLLNLVVFSVLMAICIIISTDANMIEEWWWAFYWAFCSILNLGDGLNRIQWIASQMQNATFFLTILIHICNIYGIILLAVFTGAIVRKLIR